MHRYLKVVELLVFAMMLLGCRSAAVDRGGVESRVAQGEGPGLDSNPPLHPSEPCFIGPCLPPRGSEVGISPEFPGQGVEVKIPVISGTDIAYFEIDNLSQTRIHLVFAIVQTSAIFSGSTEYDLWISEVYSYQKEIRPLFVGEKTTDFDFGNFPREIPLDPQQFRYMYVRISRRIPAGPPSTESWDMFIPAAGMKYRKEGEAQWRDIPGLPLHLGKVVTP